MTTVLFPASSSQSKSSTLKKHYPVLLGDIARGASDAIDALELFGRLLRGQDSDPSSVGFMAYDAHVGDTSCQLRAGMMREAFSYHQQLHHSNPNADTENPTWLLQMTMALRMCKDAAQDACYKMTKKKVRPVALGFNAKTETGEKIAEALGWVEPELMLWEPKSPAAPSVTSAGSDDDNESMSTWSSVTSVNNSVFSTRASSPVPFSRPTDRIMRHSASSASLAEANPTPCSGGCDGDALDKKLLASQNGQESGEAIKWNLLDGKTMVRFIVYTYVLSKYKHFCRLENVVGARLDAKACAKFGEDLIKPYNDEKNNEYAPVKVPKRVEVELHNMQVWVSELSCSFLSTLAQRSSLLGFDNLLSRSLRRAVTKHAAMPTYLGYLLMREDLASIGEQIILVDRHFCKDGFHSNIFIAYLEADNDNYSYHGTSGFSLGPKVTWRVEPAPADYLTNLENDTDPHVVIMGNSIEGTYADYMTASHPDAHTSKKHEDACAENESHVADFLAADHDRLSIAFMATHKHYAFPLSDPKENEAGEGKVVFDIMEQEQPGLGVQWESAKDEAASLGCVNDNLRIFSWQHIVLETRNRLAKKVAERKDMMPLSADVPVIAKVEAPIFLDDTPVPTKKERRRKPQYAPAPKAKPLEQLPECPETPRAPCPPQKTYVAPEMKQAIKEVEEPKPVKKAEESKEQPAQTEAKPVVAEQPKVAEVAAVEQPKVVEPVVVVEEPKAAETSASATAEENKAVVPSTPVAVEQRKSIVASPARKVTISDEKPQDSSYSDLVFAAGVSLRAVAGMIFVSVVSRL